MCTASSRRVSTQASTASLPISISTTSTRRSSNSSSPMTIWCGIAVPFMRPSANDLTSSQEQEKEETMPLLKDHIAVVTGAASGIGRAIAKGYAQEGARVALLDIDAKAAADVASEIN